MQYRERLKSLQHYLSDTRARGLLLREGPDVRYLCGFSGSNALLLVLGRRALLFTDSRYTEQAAAETAGSGVRVVVMRNALRRALSEAHAAGAFPIAYDASHTSVAALRAMEKALPEQLSPAERRRALLPFEAVPTVAMRRCKDSGELAMVEQAAALGCRLFELTLPHLASGVPERHIAAELEYQARCLGAEGMSFGTIVASGPRSALPHGQASDAPLPRRGFVTMDFGVILGGYCSDMTRTVYLGKPAREERDAYEAVLEAEQAGVSAVRAGVGAGAVDAAARNCLRRRGLGRYFTHSTGHGVGLEIHEGPRLGKGVQDTLAAGMVITVEPGVYLPGRFGIRIEDMVAVEAERGRVLTPTPRELLTL